MRKAGGFLTIIGGITGIVIGIDGLEEIVTGAGVIGKVEAPYTLFPNNSLDAFVNHDAGTARQVASEDDEVDNLYTQVFRELLTYMAEDPRTITRATRLIWVAHNLERSADRVTNICERVVFTVTGKMEEIGASKY